MLFRQEKCEFLPYMSPNEVITDKESGKITHIVLARNEYDDITKSWVVDEDQTMKKKCDFIISAFGSGKVLLFSLNFSILI